MTCEEWIEQTMLTILTTFLIFGFTISLLVFIHEGGHFLVAKWAGVWVHEFAIGFGPAIFRKKKGETEYTFRILPLGGFVRMAGEESQNEEDEEVPADRLFSAKSPWARMAVIFAGPLFNIVFAVLMVIAYIGIFGTPYVEIVQANPVGPSSTEFVSGDKVISLNGEDIYFIEQIQGILQSTGDQEIDAVLLRGEEEVSTRVQAYWDDASARWLLGIHFVYPLNRIESIPAESQLAIDDVIRGRDIILAVNGIPTVNEYEATAALTAAVEAGGRVDLKIQRENEPIIETFFDASITSAEEIDRFEWLNNPVLASTTSSIGRVEEESFLYEQGLRAGDKIDTINGQPFYSSVSLLKGILQSFALDSVLSLRVEREGQEQLFEIDIAGMTTAEVTDGAFLENAQRNPENILDSAWLGIKRIGDIMTSLWLGIRAIFTGQIEAGEAFRGPVGIANILGWSLTQGFDRFFNLVALLSLVLGVFNLVPFPALDGSRIVFIFYELVRGKPFPPDKEGWVHYIGFILLMGLIVIITWQDIQRLFRGEL